MPSYSAPINESKFLLCDWLKVHEIEDMPGFDELTPEFVESILSAMARFTETVTFPINMSGDRQGCSFSDGEVTTPDGFKQAYQRYRDDGWFGLSTPAEYNGMGLPMVLANAATEYMVASNPGFGMFVGMNETASKLLLNAASTAQKETYLPRFGSGEWSATMVMTEANAGSDLGLMRTRATEQDDGSFRIAGTKIFISSGEHDLSENIIHLVLAKIPGGPDGSKGISLFIVPKFLVNEDGSLGAHNNVHCESIEEKMGLHGSATCTMRYDDAIGHLVGKKHEGLRPMFEMMNATRVFVGMQATGNANLSYQNAANYCKERSQGRSPGSQMSANEAEAIIVHPDVRRMLMFCKSFSEGARAFCLWASLHLDISERHPDAEVRDRHATLAAFLTPIVKGYISDMAERSTSTALQCFGGHGYIVETGVEQYLRDVRVTRIYEGTSGIQAMDLVGRKLLALGGAGLHVLLEEVESHIEDCESISAMKEFNDALRSVTGDLSAASQWFATNANKDLDNIGATATHYLEMAGIVVLTFMWSQMALECLRKDTESLFRRQKIVTGRYFIQQFCPDTKALLQKIQYGCGATMELEPESF